MTMLAWTTAVPVDGRARLVNIGHRRHHAMRPVRVERWMVRDYTPRPPTFDSDYRGGPSG